MSEGSKHCTTRHDRAYWQLQLVDPDPPVSHAMGLCGFTAGDIDDDGHVELFAGGDGALLWYRPATFERGVIAEGQFHVGLVIEDVDGDGRPEVVTSEYVPGGRVVWFKPDENLHDPWAMYVIDSDVRGCHDVVFADIDSDGKDELVTAAITAGTVDIYKPGLDVTRPWQRRTITTDKKLREGTDLADVNGDGRMEVMCGPSLFTCSGDNPFGDAWIETPITRDFRNMCRAAFVDITGNGRPDILMCESEYQEGKFSWFENLYRENPEAPWKEHEIDCGLTFGHSMQVRLGEEGATRVFLAEMAEGGWNAPRNRDARIMTYETRDKGMNWECVVHTRGQGSHQAFLMDVDMDGEDEVVGKEWKRAQVQVFKRLPERPPFIRFEHQYIDLDKPYSGIEILPCDVGGDGSNDIVCGAWWYRYPDWERFEIPGIEQVVAEADLDGDGRRELVCLDRPDGETAVPYQRLTEKLVWLKAVDPEAGRWEKYPIGTGMGDWPHGSVIAPVLPAGKQALVIAHHGAWKENQYPELFAVPDDPTAGPWPKRTLAEIRYSEQIASGDLLGNGRTDLVLGQFLLENRGDGTFKTHCLIDGFQAAQTSVADISGNGKPDIILAEQNPEKLHGQAAPQGELIWLENGADWNRHVIDHQLRWPHSLDAADLDGDGQNEIVVGEHDPGSPYRSRCRLLIYKKANPEGTAWYRYVLDDRFEHHCGTKLFEIEPGRWAIASHGWADSLFVHLWVQVAASLDV